MGIKRNRPMQIVRATDATGITANITPADDTVLVLPVQANSRYVLRIIPIWENAGAGDFRWGLKGPTGATAQDGDALTTPTDIGSGGSVDSVTTDNGMILRTYHIVTGATHGDLTFQWAQKTSDAGATVLKAGSCMILEKVS